MTTWAIYVPSDSVGNFELALERGVWGGRRASLLEGVDVDDTVVFFHHLSSTAKPRPAGYPRVATGQFEGLAERAIWTTASSAPYEDSLPIWDDASYPFRFNFSVASRADRVVLREHFDPGELEGIRLAAINPGRAAYMEELPDIRTLLAKIKDGQTEPYRSSGYAGRSRGPEGHPRP